MRSIRVAVLDGDLGERTSLSELLQTVPDVRCVSRMALISCRPVQLRRLQPQLLVVDSGALCAAGCLNLEQLRLALPECPAVVLARFIDPERLLAAIRAGACGCVRWQLPPRRIRAALVAALAGKTPLAPEITPLLLAAVRARAGEGLACALTVRERRLLGLLADGQSYALAAQRLNVGVNTVRSNIRELYAKLGVHSKSQAVSRAMRAGLIR